MLARYIILKRKTNFASTKGQKDTKCGTATYNHMRAIQITLHME